MDDTFIRAVAALQAHLVTLEEEADAFTELSDMQAVRQLKTRLNDYIEAHAAKGALPADPYGVIAERLKEVERFFDEAEKESDFLLEWKRDWLEKVPNVGLADLQEARAGLEELVHKLPEIQARLAAMIHPLDWGETKADLHPELQICASSIGDLSLPDSAAKRGEFFQFSHGNGKLSKRVSKHFSELSKRIGELEQLHARHAEQVQGAEQHLANHNFRSAAEILAGLEQNFSDIPYAAANEALENLMAKHREFENLHQSLDEQLKGGGWKNLPNELDRLRRGIAKPESELGSECQALLDQMESRLSSFLAARKSKRIKGIAVAAVLALLGTALFLYVSDSIAKAEQARVEAAAKAERERAEALTKLLLAIQSGEIGKTLDVPLPGESLLRMAYCPAGSFTMGSPASEKDRSSDEDQVQVRISKPFWLGKTEITQAQWRAVMGENPSFFKGDDLPAESVSWEDAQEFIAKVNASGILPAGWKLALPTEAQWEYACRAGKTGPYSGGAWDAVAWYEGNSGSKTHPVATKAPNAWGLHDMHGNVWEWCADWYDSAIAGGMDPKGPSSGVDRVYRGGSWNYDAASCRAARRNWDYPDDRDPTLGFRPALVPSE